MANRKMTRQDVEAELLRAERAEEESADPILEGQPYRSVEEGDPYLQGADLFGVDLSGLDLAEANLRDADLREAILDGTVLVGTDLTGAYLASARLEGADMSNAVLRREDHENPYLARTPLPRFLESATYDDRTRWPRGFDPDAHGARSVGSRLA